MSHAETKNISRIKTLNVAVSTDTILYTPFLIAYYSGDFEDTPFGKISINIIGSKVDSRFEEKSKLRGDGFATFCLIFGLADAAICDPSYLVSLRHERPDVIRKEFELFENLLTNSTKDSLCKSSRYGKAISFKQGKASLELSNVKEFLKLLDDRKVIGGLISKIAFSVACSPNLEINAYKDGYRIEEKFGKIHARSAEKKSFTEKEVTGKFIYYENPSTGYCIGQIHANVYGKEKDVKFADFGQELKLLQEDSYANSIAITCDYVSLDFLMNKPGDAGAKRITEVEDFAYSGESYLFTGILGNCEVKNQEKLQAFLYVIDKNLYEISRFLKGNDTTGLTKFLRRKFSYSESREEELLDLLVADAGCRMEIKQKMREGRTGNFTFDTILGYYVTRLNKWASLGGLYYDNTTTVFEDFKKIALLRKDAIRSDAEIHSDTIQAMIERDLLAEWREQEKRFFKFENRMNSLKMKEKNLDAIILVAWPFMLLRSAWRDTLKTKLWWYLSKPTYLYSIGSLFLIFEIVSSMCHIFGVHFSWHIDPTGDNSGNYIDVGFFIFGYFTSMIITLILLSRGLLKLKENDRYVYRDE